MQRITVDKVETKATKNGGQFTKVTDDKGATYSGFDTGLAVLNKGDVIEAEIKVESKDGRQYVNIESFTIVQAAPATLPASAPAPQDSQRQEAHFKAELIAKLWIAGKINEDHPLIVKLLTWLGSARPDTRPPADSGQQKAENGQQTNGGFKNAGEFLSKCKTEHGMNRSDVLDFFKTDTIEGVGDLNKAYLKIVEAKAKSGGK